MCRSSTVGQNECRESFTVVLVGHRGSGWDLKRTTSKESKDTDTKSHKRPTVHTSRIRSQTPLEVNWSLSTLLFDGVEGTVTQLPDLQTQGEFKYTTESLGVTPT